MQQFILALEQTKKQYENEFMAVSVLHAQHSHIKRMKMVAVNVKKQEIFVHFQHKIVTKAIKSETARYMFHDRELNTLLSSARDTILPFVNKFDDRSRTVFYTAV